MSTTVALLKYQGIAISAVLALFGTQRKPFPKVVDKALRTFFFLALVGPYYLGLPKTRPWIVAISVLYLPFYLDNSEKSGSRKSKRLAEDMILRWFKKRTNLALVRTVELDPKRQYIFGIHPHGFLPFGGISNTATDINKFSDLFPGIDARFLAASFCFYIPIYRDILLRLGFCDAARYVASEIIHSGKSVMLVVGGATEALYSEPGANTVVMKKRNGFIKLALENGTDLVPVFSFGETDAYHQFNPNSKAVAWFKRTFQYLFGLSLPLISHLIPRPCTITTVVGAPIRVEKVERPTEQQVQELLERYTAALVKLHDENVAKYTPHVKTPLKVI